MAILQLPLCAPMGPTQRCVRNQERTRSCSMDFGCITPEYVQRMWGDRVPLEDIKRAMEEVKLEVTASGC